MGRTGTGSWRRKTGRPGCSRLSLSPSRAHKARPGHNARRSGAHRISTYAHRIWPLSRCVVVAAAAALASSVARRGRARREKASKKSAVCLARSPPPLERRSGCIAESAQSHKKRELSPTLSVGLSVSLLLLLLCVVRSSSLATVLRFDAGARSRGPQRNACEIGKQNRGQAHHRTNCAFAAINSCANVCCVNSTACPSAFIDWFRRRRRRQRRCSFGQFARLLCSLPLSLSLSLFIPLTNLF